MAEFSTPTKSEDEMSVLSVSSNGASLSQDSIIAALREGVEAGLLNEDFQIHYSGGGGFYNVDARVKGVSTFFSDLFSIYCFTLLFFWTGVLRPRKIQERRPRVCH